MTMDNSTYSDSENELCGLPGPFCTSAAIGGFIGIFLSISLNLVNLFVLTARKSLFSPNLRLCLQVLAVIDLLGGIICHVFPIIMSINIRILTSDLTKCNIVASILVMSVGLSQLVLLVTAFDRYIAVSCPLRHRIILTKERIRFCLLTATASGIGMSACRSFHVRTMDYCDFGKGEFLKKAPLLALYNVIPCCMVMITTILNILILRIAGQSRRHHHHHSNEETAPEQKGKIRSNSSSNFQRSTRMKHSFRGAKTVAMVVSASYLVWTPYLVGTSIIAIIKPDITVSVFYAMHWIIYFTFWINPVVFFLTNRSYKKAVKDVLGFTRNKRTNETSQIDLVSWPWRSNHS